MFMSEEANKLIVMFSIPTRPLYLSIYVITSMYTYDYPTTYQHEVSRVVCVVSLTHNITDDKILTVAGTFSFSRCSNVLM